MSVASLITANGLLDIYSALSLLQIIYVPYFSDIYTKAFINQNPDVLRMMCYVILSNGAIRLSFRKHRCNALVAFSYILEAYIYLMESAVYHILDPEKASYAFFIALCMSLVSYNTK